MNRSAHKLCAALAAATCLALSGAALAIGPGSRDRPREGPPPHENGEADAADKHGRGGWWRRPVTREEALQAIDVLQRIDPAMGERLAQRYKENPKFVEHLMQRRFPRLRGLLMLKRHDERMFDLRVEELSLAHEMLKTARRARIAIEEDNQQRIEQARERLLELAARRFDVRQEIRRHEIERLEARIDRLRDEVAEQDEQKTAEIDGEVDRLMSRDTDHTNAIDELREMIDAPPGRAR